MLLQHCNKITLEEMDRQLSWTGVLRNSTTGIVIGDRDPMFTNDLQLPVYLRRMKDDRFVGCDCSDSCRIVWSV